jgi:hypothetical protein
MESIRSEKPLTRFDPGVLFTGFVIGFLGSILLGSALSQEEARVSEAKLESYKEAYEHVFHEMTVIRTQLKLTEKLLKRIDEKL